MSRISDVEFNQRLVDALGLHLAVVSGTLAEHGKPVPLRWGHALHLPRRQVIDLYLRRAERRNGQAAWGQTENGPTLPLTAEGVARAVEWLKPRLGPESWEAGEPAYLLVEDGAERRVPLSELRRLRLAAGLVRR